jgi:hydrogenase maturation protease
LHQIDFLDCLNFLEKINKLPNEIIFICIEPKQTNFGLNLSDEVKNKIQDVVELIRRELNKQEVDYVSIKTKTN